MPCCPMLCDVQISWYHMSDYIPSCLHHEQCTLSIYTMPCDWRCQPIARRFFLVHDCRTEWRGKAEVWASTKYIVITTTSLATNY